MFVLADTLPLGVQGDTSPSGLVCPLPDTIFTPVNVDTLEYLLATHSDCSLV